MRSAKSRYVTKYGRAIGAGKVTRAQHLVRTRARRQERPLPLSMQCHPMAQTPTPLHPNCATPKLWGGHFIRIRDAFTPGSFIAGFGLSRKPKRFALYVQGKRRGYTDDINYGLGWVRAARKFNYEAEMLEE